MITSFLMDNEGQHGILHMKLNLRQHPCSSHLSLLARYTSPGMLLQASDGAEDRETQI